MTRVLQVSHYYPPHVGGIEVVTAEIARQLHARGHHVEVLTTAVGARPGTDDETGVRVHRIRAANPIERRLGVPFPLVAPTSMVRALRLVGRAEVVHIHDVLYMTSWLAAIACWLRRRPYVVTVHVGVVDHDSRLVRLAQGLVLRTIGATILSRAARVLPILELQRAHVQKIARASEPLVIPNGVDTTRYRPAKAGERAEIRRRFGLPTEERLVLFVGRQVPKKGFEVVAAAGGADYRIVFAGVEAPAGWPRRGWERHIFLGPLSAEEVADLYRAVDLFVCASRGETPLAVLEAMASGLPVLLNEDPGIRAIGVKGPGARYVHMTASSLAAEISAMLRRSDLDGLGSASRAEAESAHSWSAQVDRLQAVYAAVLRHGVSEVSRVAVLTPHYPPTMGGVERYAEQVAHILRDTDGIEPVVITTRDGWRTAVTTSDGITVVRLAAPFRISATPVNPLWAWQLPRLLRRLRADLINAHSPVPGLAELACFRSAGRPVVLTYHSGTLVKGDSRFDPLLRAWERWILPVAFRRAEGLVAAGPVSMAYRTGRATVIAPAVDLERFRPGDSPRECAITYVGRIERASRWKGVHVLIDALPHVLRQVPEAVLHLVGDGDDVPAMQSRAERLGVADHVRFHGSLSSDAVAERLRRTAVCALPSLTEAECNPTVLMEALASGTPVVGSDIGGIPGNIQHGVTGLVVPPGDAEALASALSTILRDRAQAARMSEASRAYAVTTFDPEVRRKLILDSLRLIPRKAAGTTVA